MCACDVCLKCGWEHTPACNFAKFCGDWDGVDLDLDAFPRLSSPNEAHRIRGFQARDGHLLKPLRITPLLSMTARQEVSNYIAQKRKKPKPKSLTFEPVPNPPNKLK